MSDIRNVSLLSTKVVSAKCTFLNKLIVVRLVFCFIGHHKPMHLVPIR